MLDLNDIIDMFNVLCKIKNISMKKGLMFYDR